jgi:hypothetical protein
MTDKKLRMQAWEEDRSISTYRAVISTYRANILLYDMLFGKSGEHRSKNEFIVDTTDVE